MPRLVVGFVLATALSLPAVAQANVTIVPPTPHHAIGSGEDQTVRVTAAHPVFGIEADRGVSVGCTDNLGAGEYGPCGPPLPGCHAVICASYTGTPFFMGSGVVGARTEDADGYDLDSASVQYQVDTTPPSTTASGPFKNVSLEDDHGVFPRGFRPWFTVAPSEFLDSVECSVTRAHAPPDWYGCAGPVDLQSHGELDTTIRLKHAVPHKRQDWIFRARGVDDFGRPDPTPASIGFNPIPCVTHAHRTTIGALIHKGLPVTVSCAYDRSVAFEFILLGKNGHRRSIRYAKKHYVRLAFKKVRGKGAHWTRRVRVPMFKQFDPFFRSYRSATLVVLTVDPSGLFEEPHAADAVTSVHR